VQHHDHTLQQNWLHQKTPPAQKQAEKAAATQYAGKFFLNKKKI
jgi:hypothetical protein